MTRTSRKQAAVILGEERTLAGTARCRSNAQIVNFAKSGMDVSMGNVLGPYRMRWVAPAPPASNVPKCSYFKLLGKEPPNDS